MTSHNRLTMKCVIFAAVLSSIAGCQSKPLPIQIEKYCVSESGLSTYTIKLNTSQKAGEIRYTYMGQDIRYVVNSMQFDGPILSGKAHFLKSLTGEFRGSPIVFIYDSQTGKLRDGSITASCQNVQH